MVTIITKLCAGCKKPIPYQMKRCPKCMEALHENMKISAQTYNRLKRNKKHDKFYHSKPWKLMSLRVIRESKYKCGDCKKNIATEVHHKEPLSVSWERRLDRDNLTALCHSCHMKREAEQRKGR